MKIIFITREGYGLPGARVRCYNFSRELARYGIDTQVLSFSDTLGAKDGAEESGMGMRDKMRFNYLAFKQLRRQQGAILYLQRFNYHSFAPYLLALLNKNKLVLDLDDWEMRENPRYYFGFYPSSKAHYFTGRLAKKSIFCVAASRFLRDFLLEFNKNVYYVPSGVDTSLFSPAINPSHEKELIFSWVGTFHKMEYIENIAFALECFSILRKKYSVIFFDIVGDGIYKDELLRAVARYNDPHIRLLGWLPPDRIPEYLSAVDIGLFPAVGDTKFNRAKSPTKLFEYMAMGKPVVASSIGEAPYIIKDGYNGFLAAGKEEFVNKMQNLIENAALRKLYAERSLHTVKEHFSLEVLGKRLYEVLTRNL